MAVPVIVKVVPLQTVEGAVAVTEVGELVTVTVTPVESAALPVNIQPTLHL